MQINKSEIVVIGSDENALMFNTVGIKGYVCLNSSDLSELVNNLVKENVKIFIVSNNFKEEISIIREHYQEVYPIFLLLTLDGSSNSDGIDSLRKDVERAIGISLI